MCGNWPQNPKNYANHLYWYDEVYPWYFGFSSFQVGGKQDYELGMVSVDGVGSTNIQGISLVWSIN